MLISRRIIKRNGLVKIEKLYTLGDGLRKTVRIYSRKSKRLIDSFEYTI
jgi:hypothetical protein